MNVLDILTCFVGLFFYKYKSFLLHMCFLLPIFMDDDVNFYRNKNTDEDSRKRVNNFEGMKRFSPLEINVLHDTDQSEWQSWHTNTGKYDGWRLQTHPLLQRKIFGVCQVERERNRNLLISPVIELPKVGLVDVAVVYTLRGCQEYPDNNAARNCREYLTIELNQTNGGIHPQYENVQKFLFIDILKLGRMSHDNTSLGEHVVHYKHRFSPQSSNLVITVSDEGTCSTLRRVHVTYNVCPQLQFGLFTFPRTVPTTTNQSITVTGECGPGSALTVTQTMPNLKCDADNGWSDSVNGINYFMNYLHDRNNLCQCLPGYGVKLETNDQTFSCHVCRQNEYKRHLGNSRCLACPRNSFRSNQQPAVDQYSHFIDRGGFYLSKTIDKDRISDVGGSSEACQCQNGYFRHPLLDTLDSHCTTLPSEPRQLSADESDSARIVLRWQSPKQTGGRDNLWYEIECHDSEGVSCNDQSTFIPPERTISTKATLVGLQLGTKYVVRVIARNELSDLFQHLNSLNSSAKVDLNLPATINSSVENLRVDPITISQLNDSLRSIGLQHSSPGSRLTNDYSSKVLRVSWEPPTTEPDLSSDHSNLDPKIEYQVYVWLSSDKQTLDHEAKIKPRLIHFLLDKEVYLNDFPIESTLIIWVRPRINLRWGQFSKVNATYMQKTSTLDSEYLAKLDGTDVPIEIETDTSSSLDPHIPITTTKLICLIVFFLLTIVIIGALIILFRFKSKFGKSMMLKPFINLHFKCMTTSSNPEKPENQTGVVDTQSPTKEISKVPDMVAELQKIDVDFNETTEDVDVVDLKNVNIKDSRLNATEGYDENTRLLNSDFHCELDADSIRISSIIGEGEFGKVCAGFLNGDRIVAIKMIHPDVPEQTHREFLQEARTMEQLSHPNVVTFLGVITKSFPNMIVIEFMENGSLDKYLIKIGKNISLSKQIKMLLDVCRGMEYVAFSGYVHRDLAARNILVNKRLVCKISDFGMAEKLVGDFGTDAYTLNEGKVPVRWTAPEAVLSRRYTTASDVWSFGIVCWEVFSYGQRPYWDWSNRVVVEMLEHGYRLPAPDQCPANIYRLMNECWLEDAGSRPHFTEISQYLFSVLDDGDCEIYSKDQDLSSKENRNETHAIGAQKTVRFSANNCSLSGNHINGIGY